MSRPEFYTTVSIKFYEAKGVRSPREKRWYAHAGVSEGVLLKWCSLTRLVIADLDIYNNSLRNGGIVNHRDSIMDTPEELIGMRNMGGKSIGVIEKSLKEKGISLQV